MMMLLKSIKNRQEANEFYRDIPTLTLPITFSLEVQTPPKFLLCSDSRFNIPYAAIHWF